MTRTYIQSHSQTHTCVLPWDICCHCSWTAVALKPSIICDTNMGQFLQDGENGRFVSLFFPVHIFLRKNAQIAISRKRHFRSPKRKTETTFIDLNTPQNVGKLTSETTFGHSKVVFRPLLRTKRVFSQKPLTSLKLNHITCGGKANQAGRKRPRVVSMVLAQVWWIDYVKTSESPYLGNGTSDHRNEKRRPLL